MPSRWMLLEFKKTIDSEQKNGRTLEKYII